MCNKLHYLYKVYVSVLFQVATPGPGSYGEGGIPSARLERRKSASNVGMMEGSSRRADSARSTVS